MRSMLEKSAIQPVLKGHMLNLCALLGLFYLKDNMTNAYDVGYFSRGAS